MPVPPPSAIPPASRRLPAIDAARGIAILAMVAYHLSWDLDALGFARFDLFTDPLWLAARTAILGSFLVLAGVSLVLAGEGGLDGRRFLRRLGLLVAAAAAVSAGSYAVFPDSPIFFGVLHHLAAASVLGLAFLRLPAWLTAALGVVVYALPEVTAVPLFDAPALRWIGLMTFEPDSNDYVPLFPWFGLVLLGIALGRFWSGRIRRRRDAVAAWRPSGRAGRALTWAGRHGLPIYLVHQPVLYGGLSLLAMLSLGEGSDTRVFLETCEARCAETGGAPAVCAATCGCVADEAKRAGLWPDLIANRLPPESGARVALLVRECRGR
ncbi:MAG TPA: heparan-alpha-glucosaminide N-acetyltransferase [Azospirillum sp.]